MARNLLYTFIVLKAFPAPKTLFPINIARNLDTSVYPQSTILYSYWKNRSMLLHQTS